MEMHWRSHVSRSIDRVNTRTKVATAAAFRYDLDAGELSVFRRHSFRKPTTSEMRRAAAPTTTDVPLVLARCMTISRSRPSALYDSRHSNQPIYRIASARSLPRYNYGRQAIDREVAILSHLPHLVYA